MSPLWPPVNYGPLFEVRPKPSSERLLRQLLLAKIKNKSSAAAVRKSIDTSQQQTLGPVTNQVTNHSQREPSRLDASVARKSALKSATAKAARAAKRPGITESLRE